MVHVILAVTRSQSSGFPRGGSRGCSSSYLAPRTSRPLSSQNSRELPQKQRSSPTKPQGVKVVAIQTQTIKPRGYEVTGTTLGGNEVCRLKVLNPSSFFLPDLYKVIEKNTDGDLCLVTRDGGILPGRDQVVTLTDALSGRHNLEPADDKETAGRQSFPKKWGASLRKLLNSMTSRGKKAQQ